MSDKKSRKSAFAELGLKQTIDQLVAEVQQLYRADAIPWVVGYSGGKDSTAVLQLLWKALSTLPKEELTKQVYVISTDTLVENPVVASWVSLSLNRIRAAAAEQQLPIEPHRLTPAIDQTFWVNLIGRGYPAPRHKFRWCTERMKINPSNTFITNVVKDNGEAIVVLGTRKAESSKRASTMEKYEKKRIRDRLSPNASLPNSLVYSPIETWSNDDVWMFLMQQSNPWGHNNKELLGMYSGATEGGECPLVIDTTTPSCGNSRFGCWVCTMVDKDRSMSAMIQNDAEKEWMLPLMELREELDVKNDRHLRDFRRMSGVVQLHMDRAIHGPYTQRSRENWLRKLLEVQQWVREHGPESVCSIELVTIPELEEIRRLWVKEKHEVEDSLPRIYREVVGTEFPGASLDDHRLFGAEEMDVLRDICGEDELHFGLVRELLDIQTTYRTKVRRGGLFKSLEKSIRNHFFDGVEDATDRAQRRLSARTSAAEGKYVNLAADEFEAADAQVGAAALPVLDGGSHAS